MVETFTPQTADKSFAVRIGAWCAYRGAQNLNLSSYIREVFTELPVIIADQVDGVLTPCAAFGLDRFLSPCRLFLSEYGPITSTNGIGSMGVTVSA